MIEKILAQPEGLWQLKGKSREYNEHPNHYQRSSGSNVPEQVRLLPGGNDPRPTSAIREFNPANA
jgi:hypothetical protein